MSQADIHLYKNLSVATPDAPRLRAPIRLAPQPQAPALVPGSVNIDMDTLADYARGYAFSYKHKPDPVYEFGLNRFLDLLGKHDVKATIFVVARDARLPAHEKVLRLAVEEGHEIANHTLTHPRKLASLSTDQLVRELVEAHEVLSELRGSPVVGFRAPCYDVNARTLNVLRDLDYLYDSSVHPIALAAAIDLAVLVKSRFKIRELRMGTYLHLFAPVRPYFPSKKRCWRPTQSGSLIELPLSTVPKTRMPFYGTFIQAMGMERFRKSLAAHARSDRSLNFHFHAVELVDMHDEAVDPRFSVHPGLSKPVSQKLDDIDGMLRGFKKHYDLMTLESMAQCALNEKEEFAPPTGEES